MVRRREQRLRTVLPLRIFGMDSHGKPFTDLAHTLDISPKGARIAGLQHTLAVGETVGVQRGTDKARFRVVWAGKTGTKNQGQAGLVCIQDRLDLWGIDFAESEPDRFDLSTLAPKQEVSTERRAHVRYPCDLNIDLQVSGSTVTVWGRCVDIGFGGCYVETRSPFPLGTEVYIALDGRIRGLCSVRNCHPSMGMGLRFQELGEDDSCRLAQLLKRLERVDHSVDSASLRRSENERLVTAFARLSDELKAASLSPSELSRTRTILDALNFLFPAAAQSPNSQDVAQSTTTYRPN